MHNYLRTNFSTLSVSIALKFSTLRVSPPEQVFLALHHHKEASTSNMKQTFAFLALVALFGHLALAVRWEIFPLVPTANIDNFNISSYDPAVFNVTRLPDLPSSNGSISASPSPADDPDEECKEEGNNRAFCVIEADVTKCNIAVRIPSLPVSPPPSTETLDALIF
jgi:hypothetical protein